MQVMINECVKGHRSEARLSSRRSRDSKSAQLLAFSSDLFPCTSGFPQNLKWKHVFGESLQGI